VAVAPHIVSTDPLADLRELVDRLSRDLERGEPSQSMVAKINEDVRDLDKATQRVESERAESPEVQLAELIGGAVARGITAASAGGGAPIGRGGLIGLIVAVVVGLLGSPIVDRIMSPAGKIDLMTTKWDGIASALEAKVAANEAVIDQRMTAVEKWQGDVDRRLAAEARTNAWFISVMKKQTGALAQIAGALHVKDVDLDVPVLWPE